MRTRNSRTSSRLLNEVSPSSSNRNVHGTLTRRFRSDLLNLIELGLSMKDLWSVWRHQQYRN